MSFKMQQHNGTENNMQKFRLRMAFAGRASMWPELQSVPRWKAKK